ncbi:helix-turn-helix domain-containing protein, partial [Streptomyces venezuelae]
MPGWKALPDELDPDVRAFTERLRRLVDRSGLGVSAVAERTGHERAAWDRYLNARQSAPRSAVVALAEVTGSDPAALATDWERADRAWTRAEALAGSRERATPPEATAPG